MAYVEQEPPVTFEHHDGTFVRTGYCPLFSLLADGRGNCTDRSHDYYLNACRHWPSHPDHLEDKPNCTYQFERVGDGS
jgi:hypothetical protein